MAEENQVNVTEIEVRGLAGDSITVSIPEKNTIQDLKNLLINLNFPPASSSPNFHLFLEGEKLSLCSHISDHPTKSGEFIIVIPFTKKDRQQVQKPNESVMSSKVTSQCSSLNFADSIWSDMMQDLSFMQNTALNDTGHDIDDKNEVSGNCSVWSDMIQDLSFMESTALNKNQHDIDNGIVASGRPLGMEYRTRSVSSKQDSLILSILQSSSNSTIDEKNCEWFIQVLDSINCLAHPLSGTCMLRDTKSENNGMDASGSNSFLCLCPSWLKHLMKSFGFLNLYSAIIQLQRKKVTLSDLQGGLDQLAKFGFQADILDLEQLSVLVPKVVHFVDCETDGKRSRSALVILRSPPEQRAQVRSKSCAVAKKGRLLWKAINAMKKRDGSFKFDMWRAVKLLLRENGNDLAKCYSLEDVLMIVKAEHTATSQHKAKRARSCSSPSTSGSSKDLCHDTSPLQVMEMVEHLKTGIGSQGQIVHIEEISGRKANYVDIPAELSENMKSALKCIGITRLYSHQAESIKASLAGKNVVVATMTSSGKSLCYNVPVLEALSEDLSACAFFLFPTKALAQDQLRALLAFTKDFNASLNVGVYDGDTSQEDRMWLRNNARLIITNPDMLHISILPFHGLFKRMLANLRFVIIDEAHVYKGAFGCHTAHILRRLRRICGHVYGSDPSFVFCTATSANPSEHTMELGNLPKPELIQNDGSPSGLKHFVLWNPPLSLESVSKKKKMSYETMESSAKDSVAERSSPMLQVSYLFAEMVQHGLRCIAFCKTRKLCELVLSYTRGILQETASHLVDSVSAYRGGYTAQDRRRIERDFFAGNLLGVAATNALELGIDIGHIDVTLHLGFPGSISSLWQQAGRAGRREKPSLAIYVAFEGPLDQYFMKFPHKLFGSLIECCHVDATNQQVLEQHLVCAAHEHPLSLLHDEKYFGPAFEDTLLDLKIKGHLSTDPSRDSSARIWLYIGHKKVPSRSVNIRAMETEKYKVIDQKNDEVLEEIEESKAFFQVYEGAVYMNQGKTYLVKNLDLEKKIAVCQEADLKYYTQTQDYTDIHVTGGKIAYPARISSVQFSRTSAQAHTCKVTTTWFGFRRIWRGSNKVFDTVELSLPKYSYNSQAVWVQVAQSIKAAVQIKSYSFREGLHAACHALLNVIPLYIICNSSDIASECVNPYDTRYVPERILLYDPHPGGTGISAQIQPLFTELLGAALDLLTACSCFDNGGCPKCIQNFSCSEYNEVLHKDAALMIMKGVLDAEKTYAAQVPDSL